jgi:tetratricopeptide (TPR) repeat protein
MIVLGLPPGASSQEPEADLRAGRYQTAIAGYQSAAAAQPQDVAIQRGLIRALAEVGRYEEAEAAARAALAATRRAPELWTSLGQVLEARGRLDEAEEAYAKAIAGRAVDALTAEANRGALRYRRGDRDEARRAFGRLVAAYNRGAAKGADDLIAVGIACRHLGQDDPQAFKDALKAFDEAAEADPGSLEARIRLGELFLEKYNSRDAREALKEVLAVNDKHPRALLAMARALDFDGEAGVRELVDRSLAANPRHVPARAFRAEILVALEDYEAAVQEAEASLAVNPTSLEALSELAAAAYLKGDTPRYEEARRRAAAVDPSYPGLLTTVAEACVRNRLYRVAVELAGKAVALDPRAWRAHAVLGLNQLRLGEIEAGRKSLETSFAGDPYNVWVKNTLDLLDTFPNYRESASPRFRFVVEKKESELLSPYLAELAEEALDRLSTRYGYRPEPPIRVEVYPSHADFSVRTVGLAGMGALGVCFGRVIALDSPSARDPGSFNWGSTLWHELAHTVTLALSGHRVPRWVTEGLSVLEERRARPGWGDDVSLDFLVALKAGKLLPLGSLNDGFIRPTGPEQVALSYYQASLVMERIEQVKGFPAVLGMLQAYRDGRSTPDVFQSVLGTTVDAFDASLQAHWKERFAGPLAAVRVPDGRRPPSRAALEERARNDPQDFIAHATLGLAYFGERRLDEALPHLERAKALIPEAAGEESPYLALALIKKDKGRLEDAADELRRLTALNESHYRANLELSEILETLGDVRGAMAALERAVYIYPLEERLHQRRSVLAERLSDKTAVLRARRSLVALDPVDKAEALYQLAAAYLELGDVAAARREVVKALEAAPRFQRAQELLLRIHRQGGEARP